MRKWWPFAKKPGGIAFDALAVPVGSTVLLRPGRRLTATQYAFVKEALTAESARCGVRLLVLDDADWQATVIGTPE